MLTKEQIEQIENDKKLFFFVVDILKAKKQKKEVEARATLKNGNLIRIRFLKDTIE